MITRKGSHRSRKAKSGKPVLAPNNLYTNNIGIFEIRAILVDENDRKSTRHIWIMIIIASLGILIMVQIRLSILDEKVEYIDKLQSYRHYKKVIINGEPGKTLAIASALVQAVPYFIENKSVVDESSLVATCSEIITAKLQTNFANKKRVARPSNGQDLLEFVDGETSSAMGQILSCPATNIKMLNLNPDRAKECDIKQGLDMLGFDSDFLESMDISIEEIVESAKRIILETAGGFPQSNITYEENPLVKSTIESQILGPCLIRSGKVNISLVKGQEPASAITKRIVEQYLTKIELLAYNIALKSGDANLLKKYTNIINTRVNAANKAKGDLEVKSPEAPPEAVIEQSAEQSVNTGVEEREFTFKPLPLDEDVKETTPIPKPKPTSKRRANPK